MKRKKNFFQIQNLPSITFSFEKNPARKGKPIKDKIQICITKLLKKREKKENFNKRLSWKWFFF